MGEPVDKASVQAFKPFRYLPYRNVPLVVTDPDYNSLMDEKVDFTPATMTLALLHAESTVQPKLNTMREEGEDVGAGGGIEGEMVEGGEEEVVVVAVVVVVVGMPAGLSTLVGREGIKSSGCFSEVLLSEVCLKSRILTRHSNGVVCKRRLVGRYRGN
ncbi:unnamed protein product [Closterium sp. Yama58-4]|nr:unnamed protein product [Closterium sp. Yama58-4]